MSILTPERREYLKTQVRELTIMEPNVSALRATELLNKRNLEISYDYVNMMMKEIDIERVKEADEFLLTSFLVTFMERTKMTDKVLWNILTDKNSTRKDKLGAARELRQNFHIVFQTMFDAGVFKRKIGELEIPNMGAILDMAKAIEDGKHITETTDSTDVSDTA
jgi:hypothetical protein